MKNSTVKKIFLFGLLFMGLLIAISLYYNRGFVVHIKGNTIVSISEDQCAFSFRNKATKEVGIIINSKPNYPQLLNLLTPQSTIQIHAPSKRNIKANGEVAADVWVDGTKIGCKK